MIAPRHNIWYVPGSRRPVGELQSQFLIPWLKGAPKVSNKAENPRVGRSPRERKTVASKWTNEIIVGFGKAGVVLMLLTVAAITSLFMILDTSPWIMQGVLHLSRREFWIELDTRVNVKYETARAV